jgi:hypothetical protein
MSDDIKEEFELDTDVTYEEILASLLDGERNLELKTDVKAPQKLAGLSIFGSYLKDIGMELGAKLIDRYITILNKLMISYNRESRKEIVEAVRSMFEKKSTSLSISEKLTRNMAT